MTSASPAPPPPTAGRGHTRRLSDLLKRPVADSGGQTLGRLSDVIVALRGSDYPQVIGVVVAIGGGREVFVPIGKVSVFDGDVLKLTTAKLDLRQFERREG
jgi:sporulation protein YlmC with PRC-barrel domain